MPTPDGSHLYDFSNPFVSAVIVTKDGRFPLWTNNSQRLKNEMTGKDAGILGTEALAFLSEVTVEMQLAFLPRITATLTPPYRDAINFLDSPLMNWGTTELEVTFGYISETSSNVLLAGPFTGRILKPEVTLGADVTITLNAQGMGGLSASQQAGTRSFNNKTRFEIIKTIAEGRSVGATRLETLVDATSLGISVSPTIQPVNMDLKEPSLDPRLRMGDVRPPIAGTDRKFFPGEFSLNKFSLSETPGEATRTIEVDDSLVENGDDEVSKNALYKEPIVYAQAGKTDWRAIWELANAASCYFVWEGNVLKLFPKNKRFSGTEPARFFQLYDYPDGQIGPANKRFPILSASSPTMAVYLPGASKGQVAIGMDPDTRQPMSLSVNDTTEKQGRMNEGGGEASTEMGMAPANDTTGDGQATYPGEPSDPDVKKMMQSEYDAMSGNIGINLTIESLADPSLKPGDVIQVMGLGQRLSKQYWIIKITYSFGGSGSTMTLETVSNSAHVDNMVKGSGPSPKPSDGPKGEDGIVKTPEDLDKAEKLSRTA